SSFPGTPHCRSSRRSATARRSRRWSNGDGHARTGRSTLLRAGLRLCVLVALLAGVSAPARAQSLPGVDAAVLDDIVTGSRVLADFGVLDGFGHVSARHPTNPNHFLMSRSLAPALVTADDI